ncbi:MAG: DUF3040 domain-containing protein [Pseudonocardiaceae bacterium]
MLSDHERATLHEIQRQFLAEDPEFVQTFDARTQRLPRASRQPIDKHRRTYTVLMWITTMLSVLLLIAGSVGGALLLAAVAVALSLARRRGDAITPRT